MRNPPRPWLSLLLAGWLLGVSTPMLLGQGLAFVHAFTVGRVLFLTLLVLPGLAWMYARAGIPTSRRSLAPWPRPVRLALAALAGGLTALVVLPVWLWPRTPLGGFMGGYLAWDVAYYHLPKAVDVVQQGHLWNLALPYGQYPLGWEILLALSVGLGHSAEGLGPAAGVALLGLLLAWAVLLQDAWRGPSSLALAMAAAAFFSFYWPVPNNPWRELGRVIHYASGIGKNDPLAAALVLSALVHLPLRPGSEHAPLHLPGAALSLAAALAVKPNAGLAVLGLLGVSLLISSGARRLRAWLLWAAAIATGSLWLVRNLALLGRPFSPIAAVLQQRTLAHALQTASFWHHPDKTWLLMSALLLALSGYAWIQPAWRRAVGAGWVLYILFLFTPASARPLPKGWQVAWRLGLPLLLWVWALVAYGWTAGPAARLSWRWTRGRTWVVSIGLGVLTSALLMRYGHHLRLEPEHAWVLRDPFPQAVGRQGYASVFAYIQQEVRGAHIDFDGAPPWYVYDPALSNRLARPGFYPAGMPWAVPQPHPDHWLFCRAKWGPHARPLDPAAVAERVAQWRAQGLEIRYVDDACALARAPSRP